MTLKAPVEPVVKKGQNPVPFQTLLTKNPEHLEPGNGHFGRNFAEPNPGSP